MKQETLVEVHGIPLSSYFEDFVYKDIANNAQKVSLIAQLVEWLNHLIVTTYHDLLITGASSDGICDWQNQRRSARHCAQDGEECR